jgi:hypothetical protein
MDPSFHALLCRCSSNHLEEATTDLLFSFENPELTSDCDGYDQGAVMLHEMTHLYGTQDLGYGVQAVQALSASDAANNADTYRYYAQSVRLGGCAS